jgi:hypothetical protein
MAGMKKKFTILIDLLYVFFVSWISSCSRDITGSNVLAKTPLKVAVGMLIIFWEKLYNPKVTVEKYLPMIIVSSPLTKVFKIDANDTLNPNDNMFLTSENFKTKEGLHFSNTHTTRKFIMLVNE